MSNRAGPKVLLIDDSAFVRRILARLLKRDALIQHLFEAADAAEGYSIFKIARPDAVVLDLDLPDLHGLEILKMIKGAAPSCVVIILTTCDAPDMRDACLRHGAHSFLSKDSDLFKVAGALSEFWSSSRTTRAHSGTNSEEIQGKARESM
jgi:DNA-binding NarL/FixJ family response regulator